MEGMISIKDHKQRELLDHWSFLSPKRRELHYKSSTRLFQRALLSELPVDELVHYFADGFGRAPKALQTALDAILRERIID